MQRHPEGDGIFMDISWQFPSLSASAIAGMEAEGLDWTDPVPPRPLHRAVGRDLFRARDGSCPQARSAEAALLQFRPYPPWYAREHYRKYYSHLELESLPTAGWGYDHFPLSARYVDPQGIPFLGMTGKFHYHWGEVGGYKKPEAMIYECGAMLAQGARCSIGDHLHPTAAIDQSTMAVIGPAYKWVAERER